MERVKSELEREIAAIFRDNTPEKRRIDVAGVISVLGEYFRQLETGNWSERYPTAEHIEREKNRERADDFISGFIWAMDGAGLITDDKRKELCKQLRKLRFAKSDAAAGEKAGENEAIKD